MTYHSEHLEVRFTDVEKLEMGRDVARLNQEKRRLEQKLGEIKKQLAGEISAKETEIDRLMDLLSNGYEYRQVECRIDLDTPKQGQASIVRLDTEEVVRVRRMNEEELQIKLPLEEAPPPEPPVEEPPVDDVAPEPPVEETTAEPEPTELRRLNHSLHGGTAEIVIFTDADGQIRRYATASVKDGEVTHVYDSGTAGIYETSQEATKAAALDIWKWAKEVNDKAKPGLAKVASMSMVVFCSKVLEDLRQGKL